jgi:hypothetical protein
MRDPAEIERDLAHAEAARRRLWDRAELADLAGSRSYEAALGAAQDNDNLIRRLERELSEAQFALRR